MGVGKVVTTTQATDLLSDGDHATLRIERQWYQGALKPVAKTTGAERNAAIRNRMQTYVRASPQTAH